MRTGKTWVWVNINHKGTAGFRPCFHLPGQPIWIALCDPQPYIGWDKRAKIVEILMSLEVPTGKP